jgi:hypothetical protein
MKHIWKYIILSALFLNLAVAQKTYWVEGFEQTGVWPTSASSTTVNASTGTWTVSAAYRTTSYKYAGSASLQVSASSYIITPTVSGGISSISFYSESNSTTTRTATIYKTTDGSTYTSVGTITTGGKAFTINKVSINDTAAIAVKILLASGGTAFFDSIALVSMIYPTITTSASSLSDFGVVLAGNTSSSTSFTVSGSSLDTNVVVKAPAGFKVSLDNSSFVDSVVLSPSSGTLSSITAYARFSPTSATGTTSGNITLSSSNASTVKVSVSGTAIASEPTTAGSVAVNSITGTTAVITVSGGNGAGRVIVLKPLVSVSWMPTDGSTPNGINSDYTSATAQSDSSRVVYLGAGSSVAVNDLSTGTTYYVAEFEYNGTAPNAENYLTSSVGTTSFTTTAEAGISVAPSQLAFGNVVSGMTSAEKTITVSANYLTSTSGSITVTAPTGFAVSTTSGSGFGSSVSLPFTSSTLSATTLYVHFTPSSKIAYGDSISISGGGAAAKQIYVSGKGIDSVYLYIKTYYLDTTGNDSNDGLSLSTPLYSIYAAISKVKAGDTVYVRGGTYYYDHCAKIDSSKSGTSEAWRICFFNYPGEKPVFNYSNQSYSDSSRGILLQGNYWYFKGITICYAGDNGMKLEGSHNIIERCVFHHNHDSGLQIGFGHYFVDTHPGISSNDGSYCCYNYIHNCDSYYNCDEKTNGGNADGYGCKMHNGIGIVFRGCRSWHNSDDGFDLYQTDYSVWMDSCWTFGSAVSTSYEGNGNGFKLGGDGNGGNSMGTHIVSNGITFNHKTNCFTNNSHTDGEKIVNCLSWGCGSSAYNYFFEGSLNAGKADTFYNNVSISSKSTKDSSLSYDVVPVEANNNWSLGIVASSADYADLTEAAAMADRQADGSLPTGFARLVSSSGLIDKGYYVGLPYAGSAPDIGPFEYGTIITGVKGQSSAIIPSKIAVQNYPNPFNPTTQIQCTIAHEGLTTLKIFDLLGRDVATLINSVKKPGTYTVRFDASRLGSGVYFSVLQSGGQKTITKMLLTK